MSKSFRLTMLGFGVVAGLALLAKLTAPIIAISPDSLESSRAQSERAMHKKADAMVAEILKRPLFTPSRRSPQLTIVRAEPPKLQSRLAGVMMEADYREALFSRPGARSLSVKEGDMVDGWTVKEIEPDHVLLTSAFGEQLVRPTNGSAGEIDALTPHLIGKKATPTQKRNPFQAQPQKAPLMPGLPSFASDQATPAQQRYPVQAQPNKATPMPGLPIFAADLAKARSVRR